MCIDLPCIFHLSRCAFQLDTSTRRYNRRCLRTAPAMIGLGAPTSERAFSFASNRLPWLASR